MSLKNFRGYTNTKVVFDSQMNVIIGRNDVGKSTILEALEIFFNGEQIKIDIYMTETSIAANQTKLK